MTDDVDRGRVGFAPWHLVKHMGKYNGVLVQITDVFRAADDSNYRRKFTKTMDLQKLFKFWHMKQQMKQRKQWPM